MRLWNKILNNNEFELLCEIENLSDKLSYIHKQIDKVCIESINDSSSLNKINELKYQANSILDNINQYSSQLTMLMLKRPPTSNYLMLKK